MKKLPAYRCIKTIRAAKIIDVIPQPDGDMKFLLSIPDEQPIEWLVSHKWVIKHEPYVGGYLVIYADSYESFSPPNAFEDGYVLMTENEGSET